MGLNYRVTHLLGDADKLQNSKISHGYLIHLARDESHEREVAVAIENLRTKLPNIGVAFAQVQGTKKHIKLLAEPEVHAV
jgi:hypothetical protein